MIIIWKYSTISLLYHLLIQFPYIWNVVWKKKNKKTTSISASLLLFPFQLKSDDFQYLTFPTMLLVKCRIYRKWVVNPQTQSSCGKLSAVGLFLHAGIEEPNDLDHFFFLRKKKKSFPSKWSYWVNWQKKSPWARQQFSVWKQNSSSVGSLRSHPGLKEKLKEQC